MFLPFTDVKWGFVKPILRLRRTLRFDTDPATSPVSRLAVCAFVICVSLTGCGRFTRDLATIQIEQRVSAEKGPPCRGVDSDLEKKPEFSSLRNTVFCKQTVEVQTVAITSDYTRDVVFKIFTKYDTTNVKLWLESWELLVKRLDGIGFVPNQIGSGSGCQYWKYKLIDPIDEQTFQSSNDKGETEAGCDYLSSTRRYARELRSHDSLCDEFDH